MVRAVWEQFMESSQLSGLAESGPAAGFGLSVQAVPRFKPYSDPWSLVDLVEMHWRRDGFMHCK